jgi:hypothetical protein
MIHCYGFLALFGVRRLSVGDAVRENNLSSTDTASSSGSTPQSCPQSVEKIKPELLDAVENGQYFNLLSVQD